MVEAVSVLGQITHPEATLNQAVVEEGLEAHQQELTMEGLPYMVLVLVVGVEPQTGLAALVVLGDSTQVLGAVAVEEGQRMELLGLAVILDVAMAVVAVVQGDRGMLVAMAAAVAPQAEAEEGLVPMETVAMFRLATVAQAVEAR